MAKRLYDVLKDCNKEEEVKSEFCKFFKMKINALKSIDHYTPTILFEFKYDRNFKNAGTIAHVIAQTMYPFLLDEVKTWPCGNSDLTAQLLAANEDRFLAKWLNGRTLSSEAQEVMSAAKSLYRKFYAEIANTNWMDAKIETWDVGHYQIGKALREVGLASEEFAALKQAHDALRSKLLPKVYEYGFLNPDVEYFK